MRIRQAAAASYGVSGQATELSDAIVGIWDKVSEKKNGFLRTKNCNVRFLLSKYCHFLTPQQLFGYKNTRMETGQFVD
jgi:hypothetical protein